ncbi:MAG: hypothetical protein [Arizlama microvirus]|nr:MAG: hypothetical protein [Arizlama microvirus]
MSDTLTYIATNNTIQQSAVIIQGILLVIGAILNLVSRRR